MKVLDLCAGLGGFSQAFKDRGHQVIRVDIDSKFKPDIIADVTHLRPEDVPFHPDIVLASPPCNCFSIASVYRHWEHGKPKDEATREAIKLVANVIWLIINLNPRYWILENPRGMMRKVLGKPAVTTYFASWGEFVLKPTDLWGVLPNVKWENPRSWQKAPRSSRAGVQGLKPSDKHVRAPELRARIPYALSLAICQATELEMERESLQKMGGQS